MLQECLAKILWRCKQTRSLPVKKNELFKQFINGNAEFSISAIVWSLDNVYCIMLFHDFGGSSHNCWVLDFEIMAWINAHLFHENLLVLFTIRLPFYLKEEQSNNFMISNTWTKKKWSTNIIKQIIHMKKCSTK